MRVPVDYANGYGTHAEIALYFVDYPAPGAASLQPETKSVKKRMIVATTATGMFHRQLQPDTRLTGYRRYGFNPSCSAVASTVSGAFAAPADSPGSTVNPNTSPLPDRASAQYVQICRDATGSSHTVCQIPDVKVLIAARTVLAGRRTAVIGVPDNHHRVATRMKRRRDVETETTRNRRYVRVPIFDHSQTRQSVLSTAPKLGSAPASCLSNHQGS